jgi:hypothetical protein
MRARRVRGWRDFRNAVGMAAQRPNPAALRAEARLLTVAGFFLLGVGFPITLIMVAIALGSGSASPFVPAAIGAPPIMLGYLACHFASQRMVKAKAIETNLR